VACALAVAGPLVMACETFSCPRMQGIPGPPALSVCDQAVLAYPRVLFALALRASVEPPRYDALQHHESLRLSCQHALRQLPWLLTVGDAGA
jgi:hypothetical protein